MTRDQMPKGLAEILEGRGLLAGADPEDAWGDCGYREPMDFLVEKMGLSSDHVADVWSELFSLTRVDLEQLRVPPELFEELPASAAFQFEAVPLELEDNRLVVAVSDPSDSFLINKLEKISGRRVSLRVAPRDQVQRALNQGQGTSEVLRDVSADFRPVIVREDEQGQEQTVGLEDDGQESAPVIRLVNTILQAAFQKRASDVHVETQEKGVAVKYRIDGVLYPATEHLDRTHHSALVSRLKVMADLDIAEKRLPQDGRFRLRIGQRDIDFRVSILPGVFGEDVVVRVLDKSSIEDEFKQLDLDQLGIPNQALSAFRRAIREPYGMVLITGPTGSGKTTTLYGALSELHTGEEKIVTIEDPVEYQIDGILQVPVNEKKDLTFSRGLRSILRHDPDKVMVGEIRDPDTARIAVQSALTGHLVFTTVHANNVFDVLGRFLHMGVEVNSFVSALNCVMAQRLVRRLCPECKQPAHPEADLLERSGLDPEHHGGQAWFEANGCPECNETGYRGRTVVAEYLRLTPRIRELITEGRPLPQLVEAAEEEGYRSLREAALDKAMAGETSLREINRVTFVD